MMRVFKRTLGIAALYLIAAAHVGSPDTWFEGNAGPYRVSVQISPAGVVPGVAKVFVRVIDDDATSVSVQTNKFDATGGAPPPEPAPAVEGDRGLFAGQLWIMSGGSNSVTVNVTGSKGQGSVVIPVVVIAYARLGLDKPMAFGLGVMGLFLFAGLVTIIGAAVREGVLSPGQAPTQARHRRARIAMAITSVVLVTLLAGGWKWWNAEDAAYVESMYKPLSAKAAVSRDSTGPVLNLSIVDSAWVHRNDTAWLRRNDASAWTPLVSDHGKLMHLFAIREDMNAFAHLHPETTDSVTFPAPLPPLPAGRYRIFADIVHESGFTHTLVTNVDVPAGTESAGLPTATSNGDDSWFAGPVEKGASAYSLGDGSTMTWTGASAKVIAGQPAALKFEVKNPDGSAASLEPYMGMPGHAVVARKDGAVFVHLHPAGTISMASQMAFEMREPGDTIRGRLGKRLSEMEMSGIAASKAGSNVLSFPYAFPKPGAYRVWVQVKRGGKVQTAAFDATVAEAPPGKR
ncbi:MAG TPA: hypothetical protein VM939_06860 [Gemmatimonadaceae bacterium]|nr:hypothetical protein [Gemmatimonadaceae bacterium]